MKSRVPVLLVALLTVGGLAVVPATTADAAGGTTKGTIKVQLNHVSGKPWMTKGFYVSASGMSHNVYKEGKTNRLGVATLRVPPGKYTIKVLTYRTKYQYAPVSQDYIAIARGQVKTIGMKMYKGAQITGKVLTPTGFALKGATVAAVTRKGVVMGSTTSDRHGKYRLAGLPTGRYAVEFNQRSYDTGKNKAARDFGWAFYKGTGLSDAKFLKVYQQNKYAAATKTTGITGPVRNGTQLHVTLAQKNSPSGRLLVDHISVSGGYLQSGSVYAPFAGGTSATVRLIPGKYRLGVVYAGVSYYYTGYGQTLTRDVAAATTYTYVGQDPIYVAFGRMP